MKTKQKNILLGVAFGLICSLSAVAPSNDVSAQQSECYIDISQPVTATECQTEQEIRDNGGFPAVATGRKQDGVLCQTGDPDCEAASSECLQDQAQCREPAKSPTDCKPGEAGCCGGVKTSILSGEWCGDDVNDPTAESSSIYNILISVLNILTVGVGIAAIGGLGYGALLYTTAENKPEQVKKAIGIMTNVVIGLVAYALMYLFLNFLIPGGIFS